MLTHTREWYGDLVLRVDRRRLSQHPRGSRSFCPIGLVLGNYSIDAFDDCGGHVNPPTSSATTGLLQRRNDGGSTPFDLDAAAATLGLTPEALEAALPAQPGG
jgi:hypothetical protein